VSNQPRPNAEPPHAKESWRLRRVQRAQPHLDEGQHSWVPLWTIFAVMIVVLVAIGTFLLVWLGSFNRTDSVQSLPLTATPSRTMAAISTAQLVLTPTVVLFATTSTPTTLALTSTRTVPTARPTPGVVRYRVKPGDTLTAIAAKYHVTVRAIMTANRLRSSTIYDGEELTIPVLTPVP
jgi:LysM repeat protein